MTRTGTIAMLKAATEILIVFAGALGVIGLIQDYHWLSDPDSIDREQVRLKYIAGFVVAIGHGLLMYRRRRISDDGRSG